MYNKEISKLKKNTMESVKNFEKLEKLWRYTMKMNKLENIETKLDAIISQNTSISSSINRLNLFLTQNIEQMAQFSDSIVMHVNLVKQIGEKIGEVGKTNLEVNLSTPKGLPAGKSAFGGVGHLTAL